MDEAFYPKDTFFFPPPSPLHVCCTLKLAPDYGDALKCSRGRSAKRLKVRGGVQSLGSCRHKSEEPCQDDVGGEG